MVEKGCLSAGYWYLSMCRRMNCLPRSSLFGDLTSAAGTFPDVSVSEMQLKRVVVMIRLRV